MVLLSESENVCNTWDVTFLYKFDSEIVNTMAADLGPNLNNNNTRQICTLIIISVSHFMGQGGISPEKRWLL